MPLDNGGFTEEQSRMLDEDNQRKREQWYESEIKRLKEHVSELLDVAEQALRELSRYVDNDILVQSGGMGVYNDPHEETRITRENLRAVIAKAR